jgi:hypothetical protein
MAAVTSHRSLQLATRSYSSLTKLTRRSHHCPSPEGEGGTTQECRMRFLHSTYLHNAQCIKGPVLERVVLPIDLLEKGNTQH